MSELKVGMKVKYTVFDGPRLFRCLGPAVLLALDGSDEDRLNAPSAWIRHTSPDGFHRYRSVDQADLEPVE